MSTLVVVGVQWGDEGKGKVVDLLAREADIVARFQGGSNRVGDSHCFAEAAKLGQPLVPVLSKRCPPTARWSNLPWPTKHGCLN
jgi:hypothetical protein